MECKWIDTCPLRKFEKQDRLDMKWRKHYCEGDFKNCRRYQMEEEGLKHPDAMLPDGKIHKNLE